MERKKRPEPPEGPRPRRRRQIKRERQRLASQQELNRPALAPEPDPPVWKPLG